MYSKGNGLFAFLPAMTAGSIASWTGLQWVMVLCAVFAIIGAVFALRRTLPVLFFSKRRRDERRERKLNEKNNQNDNDS